MNDLLNEITQSQPYPLLFMCVSGAHLYGFPSPDSDYDLRGAHILPLEDVIGVDRPQESIRSERVVDGLELDLVTDDVQPYFRLLLKPNGNLLEQIMSPLVLHTTPEHDDLRALVPGLVTSSHANHYLGFSRSQWKLFNRDEPRRVKPLLYVYRVLLTGVHLMRTGKVQANLVTLNETYKLPYIAELVERKHAGGEHGTLSDADVNFHTAEYERLSGELEAAQKASTLPPAPSQPTHDALNDLLLRIRLSHRA